VFLPNTGTFLPVFQEQVKKAWDSEDLNNLFQIAQNSLSFCTQDQRTLYYDNISTDLITLRKKKLLKNILSLIPTLIEEFLFLYGRELVDETIPYIQSNIEKSVQRREQATGQDINIIEASIQNDKRTIESLQAKSEEAMSLSMSISSQVVNPSI